MLSRPCRGCRQACQDHIKQSERRPAVCTLLSGAEIPSSSSAEPIPGSSLGECPLSHSPQKEHHRRWFAPEFGEGQPSVSAKSWRDRHGYQGLLKLPSLHTLYWVCLCALRILLVLRTIHSTWTQKVRCLLIPQVTTAKEGRRLPSTLYPPSPGACYSLCLDHCLLLILSQCLVPFPWECEHHTRAQHLTARDEYATCVWCPWWPKDGNSS